MKKAIKWAVLPLLIAALLLSLSGCKSRGDALEVGGGQIPRDLYVYFLDRAYSDAGKQIGNNKDITKSSIEGQNGKSWVFSRAQQYLRDFVAVNTEFQRAGLTITAAGKGDISSRVNARWSISSAHYQKLGLDKTVLTRAQENLAKRDMLFSYYYDTNGVEAVAEEELRGWYGENYVGFIAINGYLTAEDVAGNSVRLNSEQEKKLRISFEKMAEAINNGSAVGDAAAGNEATKNQEIRESVIFKTGSGYPVGFYDEVKAIPQNRAQVITKEDYIYVVKRIDVMGAGDVLYTANRTNVLKACRGAQFQEKVAEWGRDYTVKEKKALSAYWYRRIANR